MKRPSPSLLAAALLAPLAATQACSTSSPTAAVTRSASPALSGGVAVTWRNLVNTSVSGTTLSKTGGQPATEDAFATSQQAIVSGTGTFAFNVTETSNFRFVGLTHQDEDAHAASIDFAFRIQAGHADIYEDNVYVTDNTFTPGDTLSIGVSNGVVTYFKNGTAIATSAKRAAYPLIAATSFIDPGGEVTSAQIAGATGSNVDWQSLVNATATGSRVVKTGGQPQMEDAGGTSVESLASGDGFLQFSVSETSTFRFLGFGHSSAWVGAAGMDYSFRIQGGYVGVYERGAYKVDTTAQPGDVFVIQVQGGSVQYLQNGRSLYTSSIPVSYPLVADASLIDSNAEVDHVVLGATGGSSGGTDAGTDSGGTSSGGTKVTGWLVGEGNVAPDQDPDYTDAYALLANGVLDEINPTWWGVTNPSGGQHCCTDTSQPFCAGFGNPAGLVSATANCPSTLLQKKGTAKVVPMFADDTSTVAQAQTMVQNPSAGIAFIVNAVKTWGYDGVNIDFEHLCNAYTSNCPYRGSFTSFIQQLAAQLHALTPPRIVTIAVGPLTADSTANTWDIASLDAYADGFYVMGYDEHFYNGGSGNANGPVDSLGLVQQSAAFFTKTLPEPHWSKVIWALPNYGLYSKTQFGPPDQYATLGTILSRMGSSYSTTCPYGNGTTDDFGYTCGRDPNGFDSTQGEYVFFDDLDSLADRVSAAKQAGLGGVSVWAIGNGPTTPTDRGYTSLYGMIRSFYPKP